MPFSSVHSDVGWLVSFLLLMISCTGRPLGCLRKCVTQPIALITSCHPSNLRIMFCVTVANPTLCHSATTSLIRTRSLIGVSSTRFLAHSVSVYTFFRFFVFCAHVCCATLKVIVLYCINKSDATLIRTVQAYNNVLKMRS